MIRVTINRDGLERGTADFPIRIEHEDGRRWEAREIELDGDVQVIYRPDAPLQDGARVWIEAEFFNGWQENVRRIA